MPKVPGMLDPEQTANPPGLMGGKDTQPDATSILMAASMMRNQAKVGGTPRRAKAPKGSGKTKPVLR